jgi:hypothetical protein
MLNGPLLSVIECIALGGMGVEQRIWEVQILIRKSKMKIPLEGPQSRWKDNIKMNSGEVGYKNVDWSCMVHARTPWRTFVFGVMNLRVL